MIRYFPLADAWISGKNPDDQGFPTTDLTGDTEICGCEECDVYLGYHRGKNVDEVLALTSARPC